MDGLSMDVDGRNIDSRNMDGRRILKGKTPAKPITPIMFETIDVNQLSKEHLYYLAFILNPNKRENAPSSETLNKLLPLSLSATQKLIDTSKLTLTEEQLKEYLLKNFTKEIGILNEFKFNLKQKFIEDEQYYNKQNCKEKGCKKPSLSKLNNGNFLCDAFDDYKNIPDEDTKCCVVSLKKLFTTAIQENVYQVKEKIKTSLLLKEETLQTLEKMIELERSNGKVISEQEIEKMKTFLMNGYDTKPVKGGNNFSKLDKVWFGGKRINNDAIYGDSFDIAHIHICLRNLLKNESLNLTKKEIKFLKGLKSKKIYGGGINIFDQIVPTRDDEIVKQLKALPTLPPEQRLKLDKLPLTPLRFNIKDLLDALIFDYPPNVLVDILNIFSTYFPKDIYYIEGVLEGSIEQVDYVEDEQSPFTNVNPSRDVGILDKIIEINPNPMLLKMKSWGPGSYTLQDILNTLKDNNLSPETIKTYVDIFEKYLPGHSSYVNKQLVGTKKINVDMLRIKVRNLKDSIDAASLICRTKTQECNDKNLELDKIIAQRSKYYEYDNNNDIQTDKLDDELVKGLTDMEQRIKIELNLITREFTEASKKITKFKILLDNAETKLSKMELTENSNELNEEEVDDEDEFDEGFEDAVDEQEEDPENASLLTSTTPHVPGYQEPAVIVPDTEKEQVVSDGVTKNFSFSDEKEDKKDEDELGKLANSLAVTEEKEKGLLEKMRTGFKTVNENTTDMQEILMTKIRGFVSRAMPPQKSLVEDLYFKFMNHMYDNVVYYVLLSPETKRELEKTRKEHGMLTKTYWAALLTQSAHFIKDTSILGVFMIVRNPTFLQMFLKAIKIWKKEWCRKQSIANGNIKYKIKNDTSIEGQKVSVLEQVRKTGVSLSEEQIFLLSFQDASNKQAEYTKLFYEKIRDVCAYINFMPDSIVGTLKYCIVPFQTFASGLSILGSSMSTFVSLCIMVCQDATQEVAEGLIIQNNLMDIIEIFNISSCMRPIEVESLQWIKPRFDTKVSGGGWFSFASTMDFSTETERNKEFIRMTQQEYDNAIDEVVKGVRSTDSFVLHPNITSQHDIQAYEARLLEDVVERRHRGGERSNQKDSLIGRFEKTISKYKNVNPEITAYELEKTHNKYDSVSSELKNESIEDKLLEMNIKDKEKELIQNKFNVTYVQSQIDVLSRKTSLTSKEERDMEKYRKQVLDAKTQEQLLTEEKSSLEKEFAEKQLLLKKLSIAEEKLRLKLEEDKRKAEAAARTSLFYANLDENEDKRVIRDKLKKEIDLARAVSEKDYEITTVDGAVKKLEQELEKAREPGYLRGKKTITPEQERELKTKIIEKRREQIIKMDELSTTRQTLLGNMPVTEKREVTYLDVLKKEKLSSETFRRVKELDTEIEKLNGKKGFEKDLKLTELTEERDHFLKKFTDITGFIDVVKESDKRNKQLHALTPEQRVVQDRNDKGWIASEIAEIQKQIDEVNKPELQQKERSGTIYHRKQMLEAKLKEFKMLETSIDSAPERPSGGEHPAPEAGLSLSAWRNKTLKKRLNRIKLNENKTI